MDIEKEIEKILCKRTILENHTNTIELQDVKYLIKDLKDLFVLFRVGKSLPIKKYEIDFDGNVLAGIEVSNNKLNIVGAMNGWGNGIPQERIRVVEK